LEWNEDKDGFEDEEKKDENIEDIAREGRKQTRSKPLVASG
jgi:hypothetical protein